MFFVFQIGDSGILADRENRLGIAEVEGGCGEGRIGSLGLADAN